MGADKQLIGSREDQSVRGKGMAAGTNPKPTTANRRPGRQGRQGWEQVDTAGAINAGPPRPAMRGATASIGRTAIFAPANACSLSITRGQRHEPSAPIPYPREECGVFAVFGHPEAARMTFFGLFALQHRGQESAGIVSADGCDIWHHKGMGLASEVFKEDNLSRLKGHLAIGHVRYSTTGSSVISNA